MRHYCADDGRYRFIAGDVFEILRAQAFEADVVLCLGLLYHTLRYNELMRRIRDIDPQYLVIDTEVIPGEQRRRVRLRYDDTGLSRSAVEDSYSHRGKVVVGLPSVPALKILLNAYDFRIDRFSDWGSLLRDNPGLKVGVDVYASGRRVTARCVSTT